MLLLLLSVLLLLLLLFPDKEVISVDEFVATKIQIQTFFLESPWNISYLKSLFV
jgi:hypothetical protein